MSDQSIIYYDILPTSIGRLLLAANDVGLQGVSFCEESWSPAEVGDFWVHAPGKLADARTQLEEYFKGQRREFDLSLDPQGTPFQCRVWEALRKIPYGETITYGELADRVENPGASRAVGNANGRNPLVIIQPCHRVVASGRRLGGFSSGLSRKKFLLRLERGAATIW